MKGLEFLHTFEPPFAHRSIKGTNVLVDDGLTCRLSDFGLSFIPDLAQRSRDHAVNLMPWMAPEVLAPPETGQIDLLQVDVFALGATIHEVRNCVSCIHRALEVLLDLDFHWETASVRSRIFRHI